METRYARLGRPIDQMKVTYRPEFEDSMLCSKAYDMFGSRMRFDLFNHRTLSELVEIQRQALAQDPTNVRLKYELAFTLLQNEAGLIEVKQARGLLEDLLDAAVVDGALTQRAQAPGALINAAVRLLRLVNRLESQCSASAKPMVPRRINWAVNNRCVMTCRGCFNLFAPDQLTLDQIKQGVDKLLVWGVRDMIVSGGDPVVWPALPDLINYVCALGLNVGIDTTGYTMTDELLDRLAGKVCYLGLPLHGSTNVIQNSFRRGPTDIVDRLKENLVRN